jgi:hypothetical protein
MATELTQEQRRQITDENISKWMSEPRNKEFVELLGNKSKEELTRMVCYREMKANENNKLRSYAANHPQVREWVNGKMAELDLKGMAYVSKELDLLSYSFKKAQEYRQKQEAEQKPDAESSERKPEAEENTAKNKIDGVMKRALKSAENNSASQSQAQKQAPVAKR